MPLNITQTDDPAVPNLVIEEVPPLPVGPAGAPGVAPAAIPGVSISVMPPVAAAGVRLAKIVLAITAGSIAGLILYLVTMEFIVRGDVRDAYQQVFNPSRIGSEFYTLGRLEKLLLDLATARRDPNWLMSKESLQNAESIMAMLKQLPSVTTTQKAQLADCVPLPPASIPASSNGPVIIPPPMSRDDKLDRCIATIEYIRQAALEAAAGVTDAQLATESATKINEHRQSLHTFWVQAAQLILLNLLLPLLTALFGYIFGTQQAQRQA